MMQQRRDKLLSHKKLYTVHIGEQASASLFERLQCSYINSRVELKRSRAFVRAPVPPTPNGVSSFESEKTCRLSVEIDRYRVNV